MLTSNDKIMVAMSGGVDSSVTAALLVEQGLSVSGVTMCFELPPHSGESRPSCCGLESIEDARRVCKRLGIPHHVLNYGDALELLVIRNFIGEYAQGRTPNPCVRCNQFLKFDRLFKDAKALGATHLATGHYAQIVRNEAASSWEMRKAKDTRKDQSYFLYGIPSEILPFIVLPLGGLKKDEVRAQARRFNLPVAEKKDSQDICFVPDGKYQDFLAARGGGVDKPGPVLDSAGKVVGAHKGLSHYTVGQREGLGIALGAPAYIYKIDRATNTIFIGPEEKLLSAGLLASGLNWLGGKFLQESFEAGIKIRYNQTDIKGSVAILEKGQVRVRFLMPQKAVTPGQSVVFYNGDILLGGAVIESSMENF
ncbi:MAG: tRNA 2-thiouridine(34) synthase MnmA [Candidatus Omnitrophica bacterium]|nr:tRNA 2-thiouridine(34) synthase MnmA [Candidatus Omnitrophota bacterium]